MEKDGLVTWFCKWSADATVHIRRVEQDGQDKGKGKERNKTLRKVRGVSIILKLISG